jgi:hypothetical protein
VPKIVASASGDTTLVQNTDPTHRVVVRSMHAQISGEDGTKNVKLRSKSNPGSNAPDADLTGVMPYSFILPPNDDKDGWFACEPGHDLVITLSGAFVVGGHFEAKLMPYPG